MASSSSSDGEGEEEGNLSGGSGGRRREQVGIVYRIEFVQFYHFPNAGGHVLRRGCAGGACKG